MIFGHDYHGDGESERREREVSEAEGLSLARYLGCDLVDVSAEERLNIEKRFLI
jgi:hypothetical protein